MRAGRAGISKLHTKKRCQGALVIIRRGNIYPLKMNISPIEAARGKIYLKIRRWYISTREKTFYHTIFWTHTNPNFAKTERKPFITSPPLCHWFRLNSHCVDGRILCWRSLYRRIGDRWIPLHLFQILPTLPPRILEYARIALFGSPEWQNSRYAPKTPPTHIPLWNRPIISPLKKTHVLSLSHLIWATSSTPHIPMAWLDF